ncbi:hypothetical protein PGT21_015551 [Puccinia graminis f. sp. tritici]|uniref:Uncharacterized protein n=1 Tax=Puccinia graminis f. sp. tritici TaxID=56615 RepID=A0A5B0PAG5_PUCGR|nr:hypothetical protein PGT21_015551 [Puccinia graminis f. sp. tritici]
MPVQNDPNFVRPSNNSCKALPSSSATQTTARQTCKQPQQPSSALASTSTCVACKTKKAKDSDDAKCCFKLHKKKSKAKE